jgi:hypothetical protein
MSSTDDNTVTSLQNQNISIFIGNTGDFNPEDNYSTSVQFNNIFTIEKRHWNKTFSDPDLYSYDMVYKSSDGVFFDDPRGYDVEDPIIVWDHAIRETSYGIRWEEGGNMTSHDATYIGLYLEDSINITIEDLYLPWGAVFEGNLTAPWITTDQFTDLDVQVDLFIISNDIEYHLQTWTLSEDSFVNDYGPEINIDYTFPAKYTSRIVDLRWNFTINSVSASEDLSEKILPLYLEKGYLTGKENLIEISSAYPNRLRERIFSSSFMHFYTFYGLDLIENNTVNNPINFGIDDGRYNLYDFDDFEDFNEIENFGKFTGNRGYGVKDLSSILNIRDERRWYESGVEWIDETRTWEYPELTEDNYYYWFNNSENTGNLETYIEMVDLGLNQTDEDGVGAGYSTLHMKFNAGLLDDITEPTVYAGFLNLSNSYYTNPLDHNSIVSQDILTRKITVVIRPAVWNHTVQETIIHGNDETSVRSHMDVDLTQRETPLTIESRDEDSRLEGRLSYTLPTTIEENIIINDWSGSFIQESAQADSIQDTPLIEEVWKPQLIDNSVIGLTDILNAYDNREFELNTYEFDEVIIPLRIGGKSLYQDDFPFINQISIDLIGYLYFLYDATSDVSAHLEFFDGSDWDSVLTLEGDEDASYNDWMGDPTKFHEITLTDNVMQYLQISQGASNEYSCRLKDARIRIEEIPGINQIWLGDKYTTLNLDFLQITLNNEEMYEELVMWDDLVSLGYDELLQISDNGWDDEVSEDLGEILQEWVDDDNNQGVVVSEDGTGFLGVNISNWKVPSEDPFVIDGIVGGFEIRDTFTIDFDGEFNIYNQPYIYDPESFKYIDFPFAFSNISSITYVDLILRYDDVEHPSDLVSWDFTGMEGTYFQDFQFMIDGKKLLSIDVFVQFEDGTTLEEETYILFPQLALYSYDSLGLLTIDPVDGLDEKRDILPTPFGNILAPSTVVFDFPELEGDLNAICIEGALVDTNLSLSNFYLTTYDSVLEETTFHYGYSFDDQYREQYAITTNWMTHDTLTIEWTSTGVTEIFDIPWYYETDYDINGDATYDLSIQHYDGTGSGVFDDGWDDTTLYDFGANGIWNFGIKIDQGFETQQINAADEDGHFLLLETFTQSIQYLYDDNMDGSWDYIYTESRTKSTDAIPEYRFFHINEGLDSKLFQENMWNDFVYSISETFDSDFDGIWEESITLQDIWPNDPAVMDEQFINFIYETEYSSRLETNPVYNEETGDFVEFKTEWVETSQNNLAINSSFNLCSPRAFVLDENGDVSENPDENMFSEPETLSGMAIWQHNILVPFDPRLDLITPLRTDEQGSVAWMDLDDDGFYETGAIFTAESLLRNISVALYISRSGRNVLHSDPTLFKISGDTLIPLYWLDVTESFDTLRGITFDQAIEDFRAQSNFNSLEDWIDGEDSAFWATYVMDAGFNSLMMGATALAGKLALACFVTVPGIGAIVGVASFVIVMASFYAYQFLWKDDIYAAMAATGFLGMPPELERLRPAEPTEFHFVTPEKDFESFPVAIPLFDTKWWWADTEWADEGEPVDIDDGEGSFQENVKLPDLNWFMETEDVMMTWWLLWWSQQGRAEAMDIIVPNKEFLYGIFEIYANSPHDSSELDLDYIGGFSIGFDWENSFFSDMVTDEIISTTNRIMNTEIGAYIENGVSYSSSTEEYTVTSGFSSLWIFNWASRYYEPYLTLDYAGEFRQYAHANIWHDYNGLNLVDANQSGAACDSLSDSTYMYKSFGLQINDQGTPYLIPLSSDPRNMSVANQRTVDYLEMSYLAHFNEGYSQAVDDSFEIKARTFLLAVIPIVANVMITKIFANIGAKLAGSLQKGITWTYRTGKYALTSAQAQTLNEICQVTSWGSVGVFIHDVAKETFEELVVENVISSVAQWAGLSPEFSEYLGEAFASANEVLMNTVGTIGAITGITRFVNDMKTYRSLISTVKADASGDTASTMSFHIKDKGIASDHPLKLVSHKFATQQILNLQSIVGLQIQHQIAQNIKASNQMVSIMIKESLLSLKESFTNFNPKQGFAPGQKQIVFTRYDEYNGDIEAFRQAAYNWITQTSDGYMSELLQKIREDTGLSDDRESKVILTDLSRGLGYVYHEDGWVDIIDLETGLIQETVHETTMGDQGKVGYAFAHSDYSEIRDPTKLKQKLFIESARINEIKEDMADQIKTNINSLLQNIKSPSIVQQINTIMDELLPSGESISRKNSWIDMENGYIALPEWLVEEVYTELYQLDSSIIPHPGLYHINEDGVKVNEPNSAIWVEDFLKAVDWGIIDQNNFPQFMEYVHYNNIKTEDRIARREQSIGRIKAAQLFNGIIRKMAMTSYNSRSWFKMTELDLSPTLSVKDSSAAFRPIFRSLRVIYEEFESLVVGSGIAAVNSLCNLPRIYASEATTRSIKETKEMPSEIQTFSDFLMSGLAIDVDDNTLTRKYTFDQLSRIDLAKILMYHFNFDSETSPVWSTDRRTSIAYNMFQNQEGINRMRKIGEHLLMQLIISKSAGIANSNEMFKTRDRYEEILSYLPESYQENELLKSILAIKKPHEMSFTSLYYKQGSNDVPIQLLMLELLDLDLASQFVDLIAEFDPDYYTESELLIIPKSEGDQIEIRLPNLNNLEFQYTPSLIMETLDLRYFPHLTLIEELESCGFEEGTIGYQKALANSLKQRKLWMEWELFHQIQAQPDAFAEAYLLMSPDFASLSTDDIDLALAAIKEKLLLTTGPYRPWMNQRSDQLPFINTNHQFIMIPGDVETGNIQSRAGGVGRGVRIPESRKSQIRNSGHQGNKALNNIQLVLGSDIVLITEVTDSMSEFQNVILPVSYNMELLLEIMVAEGYTLNDGTVVSTHGHMLIYIAEHYTDFTTASENDENSWIFVSALTPLNSEISQYISIFGNDFLFAISEDGKSDLAFTYPATTQNYVGSSFYKEVFFAEFFKAVTGSAQMSGSATTVKMDRFWEIIEQRRALMGNIPYLELSYLDKLILDIDTEIQTGKPRWGVPDAISVDISGWISLHEKLATGPLTLGDRYFAYFIKKDDNAFQSHTLNKAPVTSSVDTPARVMDILNNMDPNYMPHTQATKCIGKLTPVLPTIFTVKLGIARLKAFQDAQLYREEMTDEIFWSKLGHKAIEWGVNYHKPGTIVSQKETVEAQLVAADIARSYGIELLQFYNEDNQGRLYEITIEEFVDLTSKENLALNPTAADKIFYELREEEDILADFQKPNGEGFTTELFFMSERFGNKNLKAGSIGYYEDIYLGYGPKILMRTESFTISRKEYWQNVKDTRDFLINEGILTPEVHGDFTKYILTEQGLEKAKEWWVREYIQAKALAADRGYEYVFPKPKFIMQLMKCYYELYFKSRSASRIPLT